MLRSLPTPTGESTRHVGEAPFVRPQRSDPLAKYARQAATGDSAALRHLLELLSPQVLVAARAILGSDAPELDDVAQESLLALVQALPAFRGDCSVVHYACRIAVRAALASRRRARTVLRRQEELQLSEEPLHSPAALPSDEAFSVRRRHLIRALLIELPEAQADTLALRIALGYSMQEVAEATGAPVNTVRSRLRLAKEALRRRIEENPELTELLEVGA